MKRCEDPTCWRFQHTAEDHLSPSTVPCGWCDAPVVVESDHGQVVHCSEAHARLAEYVPVETM